MTPGTVWPGLRVATFYELTDILTHSSQFLLSLLACVKEKRLQPSQLRCYYVTREKNKPYLIMNQFRRMARLQAVCPRLWRENFKTQGHSCR